MISAIIITACFIGILIFPFISEANRAIVVFIGALISFFTLLIFEPGFLSPSFFNAIFNSTFFIANIHSLILILGMLFIIQICNSAGIFQFVAFRLIQKTKGRPLFLFLVFSSLAVLLGAILNNITSVIILIPLTIAVTRTLNINPTPYIISEAILANVGGVIFTISSVPNILISMYAGITFNEFFINVGLFSLFLFGFTTIFFLFYYRGKLMSSKKIKLENLELFNAWNYVPNRNLFYKSLIILLSVLICFIITPPILQFFSLSPNYISADIIAICGAMILVIISRLNVKEIIEKVDFELMLFLLGIFFITGAMQYTGIIDIIDNGIAFLTGGNEFVAIILILWISSFLSTSVDNLPVTSTLMPIVGHFTTTAHMSGKSVYYSLIYGVNLGNNLILKADKVLALKMANQNKRTVTSSEFLKLSFIVTTLQLIAVTLYFTLIYEFIYGLIVLVICLIILFLLIKWRLKKEKNGFNEDAMRPLEEEKAPIEEPTQV